MSSSLIFDYSSVAHSHLTFSKSFVLIRSYHLLQNFFRCTCLLQPVCLTPIPYFALLVSTFRFSLPRLSSLLIFCLLPLFTFHPTKVFLLYAYGFQFRKPFTFRSRSSPHFFCTLVSLPQILPSIAYSSAKKCIL